MKSTVGVNQENMEAALRLLQVLHQQILYNDSPPSNESAPTAAFESNEKLEAIVNTSSQKLGNDILASFLHETVSDKKTAFFSKSQEDGNQSSLMKQPNNSICLFTSEELQADADFVNSLISSTNDDDKLPVVEKGGDDSISTDDFIANCPGNEDGSSTSFLQLCIPPNGNTSVIHNDQVQTVDNIYNNSALISSNPVRTTRTLKMYGSEYARFLSDTPFSPLRNRSHPSFKTSTKLPSGSIHKLRKNHSTGRPPVASPKSCTVSSASSSSPFLLEDASPEVIAAPIVDICVTHGLDLPPPGYFRISKTCTGRSANLTPSSSEDANKIFLNVKKEPNGNWESSVQRPWISAIAVIFPDRNEFVPPGFCVVKHVVKMGKQLGPANLNEGAASNKSTSRQQRVYLCYKKSREGNPIVSIIPLLPSESEYIPPGFTVIEKSPRNFTANINDGSGPPIFLGIRQRLSNLETLRPLPLLKFQAAELRDIEKQKRQKLLGYYATGGFVVPCSKIGRLHSMDRMGHHYLSPSSMATRISLAYDSPAKGDFTPTYQNWLKKSSTLFNSSSSSVTSESVQTDATSAVTSSKLKALLSSWSDSDSAIAADFYQSEINYSISQLTQDGLESFSYEGETPSLPHVDSFNSATCKTFFPPNPFTIAASDDDGVACKNFYRSISEGSPDIELIKACHESMSFIPRIKLSSSALDTASSTLEDRVLILTPILTACYTFHGGLQLLALDGLNGLLSDTDFFIPDVTPRSNSTENDEQVMNSQKHSLLSPEQTLLDLTIQVVCDLATLSSREAYFSSCVNFCAGALRFAVEHGGSTSCLHARSLGYIFRLYLFVSSFEVSLPDNISKNSKSDCRVPLAAANDEDYYYDFSSSVEDLSTRRSVLDPVHVAEAALKEMISFVVKDLGNNNKQHCIFGNYDSNGIEGEHEGGEETFISSLVADIVNSAADKVNISNLMQLISDQVHRGGGSELFWYDMTTSAGLTLFGSIRKGSMKEFVCCFALLASLVKAASGNVRHEPHTYQFVPRDIFSKVFAVELLLHFMESFSNHITERVQAGMFSDVDQILMYSIRRLVVPCVLSNSLLGDNNQIVFRRCFSLVKKLWESPVFRKKHKVELAILLDQYVLRVLRFGPMVDALSADAHSSIFQQQLAVLTMLKSWLANAPLMFEILVNYDDEHGSSNISWKTAAANFDVVGQLSSLLCAFIEECVKKSIFRASVTNSTDLSGAVLRSISEADRVADAARLLLERAAIAFGDLARSLLKATTELCNRQHFIDRKDTMNTSTADPSKQRGELAVHTTQSCTFKSRDCPLDDCPSNDLDGTGLSMQENVFFFPEPQAGTVTNAFDILVEKGIKKAVEYLTACNILTPSARDIASFLRLHQKHIDPSALGDYLGEENICGGNHCDLIRYHYVRVISFVGMKVDEALRQFVTNCGFHLPGEAQRIDRIISTFAQCFWEDNAGDRVNCPFYHQDTVCLLAFSIIMLNTDLHKATGESSAKSGRKVKRMSRDEFVDNLKRALPAEELPKEYIISIYNSIEAVPMILCAPNGSSLFSAAKLAIKGSPSLEKPTSRCNKELSKVTSKSIKYSLEMLRAMSLEESSFALYGEDFDLSPNLIHRMLNTLWFHFHGTVNALLTARKPSRTVLAQCLDIVHSVISCSLQLNLKEVWQMAFVRQLAQIFFVLERLDIMSDRIQIDLDNFMRKHLYRNCAWYQELENYIESDSKVSLEGRNHVLIELDRLVSKWRSQVHLKLDPDASHKLDRVARRIRNGLSLVTMDPTRAFIREGDLMRHLSSGRKKVYRFFLFSDRLMYGHKSSSDEQYVIHSELPLAVMKIDSSFVSGKGSETVFHVFHPIKSFLVSADSIEEKNSWLHDIKLAICKAVEAYSKPSR